MKKISLYMAITVLFGISACQGNRNNNDRDRMDSLESESPYMDDNLGDTISRDSLDSIGTPLPPMPGVPMD
ncbi:hypothetical protein G5B30_07155 [Sphingobacterium sp. SGG-5]|uniref:hypothetical protein n=1 Tax=Sphingobacterium sp. SGG-5 TaxID=2710881 RepID=UPI0013ED32E5|nr:hypothetical protein [Sphingobacterium sp. SGG-5]NGM61693.1 hypothetical protein [Sphingobacterium sp. SGG-5]